jgi:hypothetical protein
MKWRFVDSRWFHLFSLSCVIISATLWYLVPLLSWQPLIIALLPLFIRIVSGRFPLFRTRLDLLLLIFLLTALIGVWASYNQDRAWEKFWLILASIFLFYTLAKQPPSTLWIVVSTLVVLGIIIGSYFLLTHDWQSQPADLLIINQIGDKWISVRPTIDLLELHPNTAGGLIAILIPFSLSINLYTRKFHNNKLFWVSILATTYLSFALYMTSSRAAWGALTIAIGVGILWIVSGYISNYVNYRQSFLFGSGLLISIAIGYLVISEYSGGILGFVNALPGAQSGESRLNLYLNTLYLIKDFVYTGGGLRSFPGLYSRYILVIPYLFFSYSHNLFLDVALEQGFLGSMTYIAIILISIFILWRYINQNFHQKNGNRIIAWVVIISLFITVIHGLVDDALYGDRGTPLLFVLPGVAIALTKEFPPNKRAETKFLHIKKNWSGLILFVPIIGLVILLIGFRKPILSQFYANLGSIMLAKTELAGWSDINPNLNLISNASSIQNYLNRSIGINPNNLSSNYRLGLIEHEQGAYNTAVSYLEPAYNTNSEHRGVSKVLGYDYVWLGQYDKALKLLTTIPEASYEMSVYKWWWETQGRIDYASNAAVMETLLNENR